MKLINRFGEIFHENKETLITMPFERLKNESAEMLEESYRSKVKELQYPDNFIYANSFTILRDRLQMSFDLDGCVAFHNIHKVKLRNMIPYLYSMIDIAKLDANILWEKTNFIIDTNEKKVKALIFEFDGFPLYKKDNELDGVKELILLALTKNESIIAKPKRADFIEKTDEVYQFSEDIIASTSVEEIERVIKGYENQKEHEERVAEREKQEKAEKSIFSKGKNKITSVMPAKKEKNTEEQLKSQLQSKQDSQGGSAQSKSFLDKLTGRNSLIGICIVAVLVILGTTFMDGSSNASDEEAKEQEQIENNEKIKEAYRLYVKGTDEDIEEAYATLDAVGYNNLPDADKSTLIDWYIEQEKYSKALKTTPDSAFAISDEILEKHNIIHQESENEESDDNDSDEVEEDVDGAIDELETLETSFKDNKVLKFDIASLEDDYSAMVENSDLTVVNERRGKKIAQSFAIDNQYDELEKLMDNYRDEQDSYENIRTYYDRYYEKSLSKEEAVNKVNELEKDIEEKENDKESTDDKDKKKKIDKEIEDKESEKAEEEENIKEIEESIKKD